MGDEGSLYGMQLVAMRDALDGEDVRAIVAYRQRQAGIDPPAVHQDRACAALAAVASLLGSGELKALAQEVEQRDARIVQHEVTRLTVAGESDSQVHAMFRSMLLSNRIAAVTALKAGEPIDPSRARAASRGGAGGLRPACCVLLYGGGLRLSRGGCSTGGDETSQDAGSVREKPTQAARRRPAEPRAVPRGRQGRVQRGRSRRQSRSRGAAGRCRDRHALSAFPDPRSPLRGGLSPR